MTKENKYNQQAGKFIISLDFELMWGIKDRGIDESYGENILNVRKVVPQLLELFEEYGIHTTWATVGFLFAEDKEEILAFTPANLPKYNNQKLSGYKYITDIKKNENEDPYHYALSLIKLIQRRNNQELGSHTFSHYYCLEKGQTKADFQIDLQNSKKIMKKAIGLNPKSLVLPRNQHNEKYDDIIKQEGITAFRGCEKSSIYSTPLKTPLKRALRLLDSYVNIAGKKCYKLSEIKSGELCNIPSSRFFRPYSHKLRYFEWLKIKCIKNQMKYAAKNNLVFHMWWHPHNFGSNTDINLKQLRELLIYYKFLQKKYCFESINMGELAKELIKCE